jgi:hypothetical protein
MPDFLRMMSRNRRLAFGLVIVWGLATLGGCGGQSAVPKGEPAPQLGKPAAKVEDESDVLPPQSEPPVVEEKPDAEKSDADKPAEDKPNGDPPKSEPKKDDDAENSAANADDAPRGKTHVLFDGTSLENWQPTNFGGEGPVEIVDGAVVMQRGADLSGIHWTGDPLPKINYEVTLEAQRVDGSDFFCGIVFPVKNAFCSFVAGGWGGSVVGLSSVDDVYAAENETGTYASFNDKEWYKFRLRVTETAITAWIDGKEYVRLKTKGRKLSLHPAVEPAKPFGVSCYATVAAVRDIKIRELTPEEVAADADNVDDK